MVAVITFYSMFPMIKLLQFPFIYSFSRSRRTEWVKFTSSISIVYFYYVTLVDIWWSKAELMVESCIGNRRHLWITWMVRCCAGLISLTGELNKYKIQDVLQALRQTFPDDSSHNSKGRFTVHKSWKYCSCCNGRKWVCTYNLLPQYLLPDQF